MKEIYFKGELDSLYEGIFDTFKAVSSTLGPKGKTVIIRNEYGQPYVTKDGVSVAKSINFENPVKNIGATLIKQVAEKTVKDAGDGTTTSVVLASSLIENLKGLDYKKTEELLNDIIPKVLKNLKKGSKKLKRKDIKHVATISANNDFIIGELIQKAYDFSDIVKVEESNNNKDVLEFVDGMQLNTKCFSKNFLNGNKQECFFEDPYVLLIEGKLSNLKNISEVVDYLYNKDKPLLIITEHVDEIPLRFLESNVINKGLKLNIIKTPGFAQHRKDLLKDLSIFTNAKMVRETSKVKLEDLGKLESCTIFNNKSILVKKENIKIKEHLEYLESIKQNDLEEYDLDLLNKRIENLKAKISIIKVGGDSEVEMKEKKDRVDDAVLAVSCALEEGVVEGGGLGLLKATIFKTECDISKKIINALRTPYSIIFPNNKVDDIYVLDWGDDFFKKNIIDPLKVTRCALENAVSVAKTILSTETIIIN